MPAETVSISPSPRAGGRRVAATLLLSALVPACSDLVPGGGGPPVVRDSAGVTVVEHPERAPDPLEIVREPDVLIGGTDVSEAYALARVGPLEPLSSGAVVVSEQATNELRFYDGSGRHVRTVEGRTRGPGIFAGVALLDERGDSLVVVDGRTQRLVYFDTAGTFLRGRSYSGIFGVEAPPEGEGCWPPLLAGVLADGSRVAWGWRCAPWREDDPLSAVVGTLRVIRAAGRDSVGTFTTGRVWAVGPTTDRWIEPPFPAPLAWAVGDDRIYVTRGEEYRIEVYDATGRLVRVIAEEGEPPPVREADREAFLETAPPGYPAEVTFPERFPAYAQLLLSDDGELWALRYTGDDQSQVWSVFSPDGETRRRVVLPAASWRAVEAGRIWGVYTPVRNVSRVVAYDLDG